MSYATFSSDFDVIFERPLSMMDLSHYKRRPSPLRRSLPGLSFDSEPPCTAAAFLAFLLDDLSSSLPESFPMFVSAQTSVFVSIIETGVTTAFSIHARCARVYPPPFDLRFFDFCFTPLPNSVWRSCADLLTVWYNFPPTQAILISHNFVDRLLQLPSKVFTAGIICTILRGPRELVDVAALATRLRFFLECGTELENVCSAIEGIPILIEIGAPQRDMEVLLLNYLSMNEPKIQKASLKVASELKLFKEPFVAVVASLLSGEMVGEALGFFDELVKYGGRLGDSVVRKMCAVVEGASFANACRAITLVIEFADDLGTHEMVQMIAKFVDDSVVGQYAFCALAKQFLVEQELARAEPVLKVLVEKGEVLSQGEGAAAVMAQAILKHIMTE
jgi:hypothetical protein